MIIKEIRINNFRSYYGNDNRFEFSDGLTLILGDNGDGKTTFFEALQWLFNTSLDNGFIEHFSEMRKSEMNVGDREEVSVFMAFEHDGEKSVEKSFTVERVGMSAFKTGAVVYRAYETHGAERERVDGKLLINRCYEAFIQRFSMFKGESELKVFDGPTALKELVDKLSDIRKFDKLVEFTESFAEKSYTAYLKEMKSDKKVANQAMNIAAKLKRLETNLAEKKKEIKEKKTSVEVFSTRLNELEEHQETSERLVDLKSRQKTQEEKRNKLKAQIAMIDYNHALLDRYWILGAFPPILQDFKRKCSALSKERRRQEKNYDQQKAKELGKLEAIKEMQGALINGATELPWYLPNQETMEEMINDHICKVCGRPAEEGSDAYLFMVQKLEQYKQHIEKEARRKELKEEIEQKELFEFNNIEDLHNLSISLSGSNESRISQIACEISDRLELVDRFKNELKNVDHKLQDIQDEKSRLLIQSGNVSEAVLEKDFKDIKGLFEQKGRAELRLLELMNELDTMEKCYADLRQELNELNPASSQVKVYQEAYRVLNEIAKAFANAKKENLRRFLSDLQEKANEYLEKLSSNDFHGEVRLVYKADSSTEICLYSTNGSEIKRPSGSQKTVMYISVLFAISDFTQQKRSEDYPLIFDAATSSFGDSKEQSFYNVIDKLNKQCIIATKDFIEKGNVRYSDIESLTCSVYRIKKAEGFDPRNMATVRTTIQKIK